MGIQLSVTVRDAQNDAIETAIGTAPHFIVRTLAQPANCAAADVGSALVDLVLPADFMGASSGGVKAKAGTWSGSASNPGTAGHFRIKDSSNTTCHMQGSCGQGSGDLSFDNDVIAAGQTVTISTFQITAGNA